MCHSAWDFKVQPLPPFFHPVAERKLYCLLVWGFTFLFITLPFICGFLSQLLLKRILKGEVKLRPTFINRENEALCFNAPVYFLLILMEDAYTHAKESVLPRNFPSWWVPLVAAECGTHGTAACRTDLNHNSLGELCLCLCSPPLVWKPGNFMHPGHT